VPKVPMNQKGGCKG